MIEAKLLYRARCDVCRTPFGQTHSTQMREMIHSRNFFSGKIKREEYEADPVYYTGPHVCPGCETKKNEQSSKIVNGCMDQSLHDNLIGMGIKKQKGEK